MRCSSSTNLFDDCHCSNDPAFFRYKPENLRVRLSFYGGGHEGLRYCGIGLFFMRCFGNSNFNVRYCSIIGEMRLLTVLPYHLFALSFRYTDAKQNTVGHKSQ